MSKERLEEINKKVVGLIDGEDFSDLVQMDVDTYAWFYEQAERVWELEELTHTQGKVILKQNDKLDIFDQQNKRYREALEFYADKETYEEVVHEVVYQGGMPIEPPSSEPPLIYLDNYGDIARKALEGEE